MEDQLPAEFWQGVDQFNQGEFYACHDTFEALWTEALEPDRTFYQGILQIAVALYHLNNHNWRGAVTLMGEAVGRLRRYDADYGGIDLAALLAQARTILQQLQQTQPEAVGELAAQLGLGQSHDSAPGDPGTIAAELAGGGATVPIIRPWPPPR